MPAAASSSCREPGLRPWRGKHIFRRHMRADAAKHRPAARDRRVGGARQVKRIVARQEQIKHLGAADDGDRAIVDAECFERLFERRARWIPKKRIQMRRIWTQRPRSAVSDQPFAARCPRAAFVRVAAMHDGGGTIEAGLEEFLIGIVTYRGGHRAVRVGQHAVGRYDDVTFDAVQGVADF